LSLIPTAVRKQWADSRKPPITNTVEVQTDPEPVSEATQTSKEAQTQTPEFEAAEIAVQTSVDADTQTVEVAVEAAQPSADIETQTPPVDNIMEAEENFYFSTLFQIVGMITQAASQWNGGR
jgi:hypothetical protein